MSVTAIAPMWTLSAAEPDKEAPKKEVSAPSNSVAASDRVDINKTLSDTALEKQRQELIKLQLESALTEAKTKLSSETQRERITELENQVKENALLANLATSKSNLLEETTKLLELQRKARSMLTGEPEDLAEPFDEVTGTLTIGQRRIPLNGPIVDPATAEYVESRIQFFNNQESTKPIFIVIDDSPGGSVSAGFRILEAMKGSRAPVYVVVKSFAASMAAGITTLAKRSFVLRNARILHHQLSSGMQGNYSDLKDQNRHMEEWWNRLAAPVAKKMGIGIDEFVQQMYSNVKSGDWEVFADQAVALKWADTVVTSIRETAITKLSGESEESPSAFFMSKVEQNASGQAVIRLPRSFYPRDLIFISGGSGVEYVFDQPPMTYQMVRQRLKTFNEAR